MQGLFLLSLIVFITGCPSAEDMNVFGNSIVDASPTPSPSPSPSATPTPAVVPDKVAIIAGNNQTGAVSATLTSTFIVQVTDASNNPAPNATVTYNVTSGGGHFIVGGSNFATKALTTDAAGLATITVALGATLGAQTFSASIASGTTTSVGFTATGVASIGPPDIISIIAGNGQTGTAGFPLAGSLIVKVTDSANHPLSGISVTFQYNVADGGLIVAGGVSAASRVVVTDSSGLANATAVLGNAAGAQSVTASIASGTTSSATFSMTATSAIGPPDKISVIAGNAQSALVDAALTNDLIVKVTDSNNHILSGASVTFTYATGNGLLISGGVSSNTHTVTTDSSGLANVSAVLGSNAGAQTITASIASGSIPLVTFTVTAISTSKVVKICLVGSTTAVGNTTATIGTAVNLRAALFDAGGTFIEEIPATWSVAGTLLSGDLTVTGGNPSKYATFNGSAQTAGPIYAIVQDAALISSKNITNTTAVTGQITASLALVPDIISIYSGNNQNVTAGTIGAIPLVARVTNSAGAAVPGESVTFTVTSGTGATITTSPATVTTNASGLAQVYIQAGTVAGNNTFTATMATNGTTKQTLFNVNVIPSAPTNLRYVQQPDSASESTPFAYQPSVEIIDFYGNRVTTQNSGSVTLSVQTGTGALGGSYSSVNFINGLATFINVYYTVAEAGVVLRATTGVGGAAAVNSNAFTVYQIITAARCASDAGGFVSFEGGCKDTVSGLVWSARSDAVGAAAMTWGQAVWNSAIGGSEAPEAWEVLRGLTSDLNGSATVDNNAASYCHTLNQSGMTDWRIATQAEHTAMIARSGATYLKNVDATFVWTGTTSTAANAIRFNNAGPAAVAISGTNPVRCVREPVPTRLTVNREITAPNIGLGRNVPFELQPRIQISTSDGSLSAWSTNTVTLTVTGGSGQLCLTNRTTGVTSNCGTSQSIAAVAGIATFANLSYTAADTLTLTASSPGLTSVALAPITIEAVVPRAKCLATGTYWMDGNGGCKDLLTGMIYSASSNNVYATATNMSWYNAVWDSTQGAAEAYEPGVDIGTNDYHNFTAPPSGIDISDVGYCHSLQQSGYNDWMLPYYTLDTSALNSAGKSPTTSLQIPNANHWESYSNTANYAQARQCAGTAAATYQNKVNLYYVYCVRRDNPANLAFYQEPSANVGSGLIWTNQPIIDIVDADGAGPLYFDSASVTLTIVPASDGTGGTGKFFQHHAVTSKILSASTTATVTAVNGRATFGRLSYSKPGQKFRVRATATTTWKGTVYNLGPVYSADYTVPAIHPSDTCLTDDTNFTTELGGCRDLASGGLVWSHVFASTWHQMVWDQSSGSLDPPKPGEARTSDIDLVNSTGNGTDTDDENVCHNAHWGGYYDWRPATFAEMNTALKRTSQGGRGGYTYLRYNTAATSYLWSSMTHNTTNTIAHVMNLGPVGANTGKWHNQTSGVLTGVTKVSGYWGICVRDPNPTSTYTPLD